MNRSPNIAIDALGVNEVGGARSVTIPLLMRVFQIKSDWNFYCYLSAYERDLDFPNVKQIVLPLSKGLFSRFLFQLIVPIFTIIYRIDITHFIKSQASFILFSKKILTIFDCTILKYPQYFNFPSRLFWRYFQPFFCKHMDEIITISQDAKGEIVNDLKVPPDKVSIVYPASQFNLSEEKTSFVFTDHEKKSALGDEYLLYIGQIGLKKNLMTLINAYKTIVENDSGFPHLFLVGPRYYLSDAGEIFDAIHSLGLDNHIHYLGPLKKNELHAILSKASILLFPSVHEGFGIPMVEAMQMGVPVIASNTSVMPEVLNDAGVLVDDFLSPSAWAEEIITLYKSPEQRGELSKKGIKRAEDFSWEGSAGQLIQIYERLL